MNHNLHDSLHSLARSGADSASTPEALVDRAVAAVERRRKRRPVMIAGLTGIGVLTAGAAAALGYSLLHDDAAPTFPDRLRPGIEAPSFEPAALACGADIADLAATDGPLVLGNEMVDAEGDTRVTISFEAGTIIPMYLRNVTDEPVTFTAMGNPGIYLVRDGRVVAVPAAGEVPAGDSAGGTLDPAEIQPLLEDRVVACPDAVGTTPTSVPAGDYDAYGAITVSADKANTATDVVGGPWKVRTSNADGTVAGDGPETAARLPQADPGATFPQCGALMNPPAGRPLAYVHGPGPDLPLGSSVVVTTGSFSLDDLSGEAAAHPTLVAVKDGVVVGSLDPDQPGGTVPFSLPGMEHAELVTTGSLQHTLCTDGVTPLPAGRYSIWAAQDLTITERVPRSETDFVTGDPITAPETYTALDQVATLWMDAGGQSVGHPGVAAGWPTDLDEEAAYRGDNVDPETVVWLAVSARAYPLENSPELIPTRDRLADLGYLGGTIPFRCQPDPEALGAVSGVTPEMLDAMNGSGIGVLFRTRAEADTFTALWEPLHGPVAGVATAHVGCDFS